MPLRAKMLADNWDNAYITELEQHIAGLQEAGVSALLNQTLIQRDARDSYLLETADGRPFGSLRGGNSAVAAYEAYMRGKYGEYEGPEIVRLGVVGYAKGVNRSSWAPMVQLVKELLVRQRTAPSHSHYFWKMNLDQAKPWDEARNDINVFRNQLLGTPKDGALAQQELNLRRAVVTWHAFTQELLRCTAFPGNDQVHETLTVVRTEGKAALDNFRRAAVGGAPLTADEKEDLSSVYGVPLVSLRGALESSSLYTIKNIHGNVVTESVVPHHRIFSLYMTAQPQSDGHMLSFFENDTENEVTFMPEGLPFQIKALDQLAFARPAATDALSWADL